MLDILRGKTRVVHGRMKQNASFEISTSVSTGQIEDCLAEPAAATCPPQHNCLSPEPVIASAGHEPIGRSNGTWTNHPTQESAQYGVSSMATPWQTSYADPSGLLPPSSFDFPFGYDYGNFANFNSMSVPDNASTATTSSTPDLDLFLSSQYPDRPALFPALPVQYDQDGLAQLHTPCAPPPTGHNTFPHFLHGNSEPMPIVQNTQQVGEVWQSFVAQAGFTTEDEMVRLWGMSQT